MSMKLLILGGTVFLGRHLVDAALARGHELTLFHRGQHGADLFPEVEKLHGDRDGGLDALRGRRWHAVIDTSGFVPRIVGASAALLADAVDLYTFISTISVYADTSRPGMDETTATATLADPASEDVSTHYGPLKALSEQAVEAALPGRALVIRPGLIVGPFDPSDRFTYWVRRVAQGGELLAPGRAERAVQLIDARDLAEWTVRAVEARRTGVYNATGPAGVLTMAELIDACRAASGSAATAIWMDDAFLLEAGVTPWSVLPLWIPESERVAGFFSVDCNRALEAGLRFRPLVETAAATLAWARERAASGDGWRAVAGLDPAKEAALLARWRSRRPDSHYGRG